jgi:hypothetical protein
VLERLVQLPLARALDDPGDLGQQVSAPCSELAQCGHRGGLLVLCEIPPPGAVLGLAEQLGDKNKVSFRAFIDHAF